MPVTVKVNGTANSLVHKGSGGISRATVPDVCKTPSPGGPVPIPYPNVSQSITLAKGSTSVKADGGMMIANKGSEFSLSNGDNAGVAGGVKSSTFMKESTWILYSFDVKVDGKSACRLSDKKFQNHENSVDLGGNEQGDVQQGKCPPHLNLEVTEKDIDDEIKKDEEKRSKLEEKKKQFEAEVSASTAVESRAKAQMKVDQCAKGIAGIDDGLPGKRWEKKVADDVRAKEGRGRVRTSIKIRCLDCGNPITDIDVLGSSVAKEAKKSGGGYDKEQHQVQVAIVEGQAYFGAGITVHVAVPAADAASVEAASPELAGRVQSH